MLNLSRLQRARSLFILSPSEGHDVLIETFSSLSAELATRASIISPFDAKGSALQHIKALAGATRYVDLRLMELFARLQQIEWLERNLSNLADDQRYRRRMYLALAIKDFHVDVASLMDSLAPVVIQVQGSLKPEDVKRLPGWADIQKSTKRSYRDTIPPDLLDTVDSTERWWPSIKEVRDLLTHRDHLQIVFGEPTDGMLFQVYAGTLTPTILEPRLLYQPGKNVVDFRLYSAFILGELLTLLDDLGRQIAAHANIGLQGMATTMLMGDFKAITQAMKRLSESLGPE